MDISGAASVAAPDHCRPLAPTRGGRPAWTRRRLLTAAAASAAVAGLATASGACARPARRPSTSRRLDRVVYLTGFALFAREGYVYVAKEKGFFAEAGIEVEVRGGQAGFNNVELLQTGKAHFAATDYSLAAIGAGTGKLDGIKLTAAVNQLTLVALMTLANGRITGPKDLAGKTICQATGAIVKTLFPGYAKLAGLDPATVRWVETLPTGLPAVLAAGQADAIGQFVTGRPAVEAATLQAGKGKVLVLPYSDYVQDLYGNVQMTTTKLIETNPSLVRRFTGAIMRGLRYAVDHPDEAAQIIHRAVPSTPAPVAVAELGILHDNIGAPFASFDPSRVMRGIAVLQTLDLIPGERGLQPQDFVDFRFA
jgi:NitT/TauT family transport system substrate-binding protein